MGYGLLPGAREENILGFPSPSPSCGWLEGHSKEATAKGKEIVGDRDEKVTGKEQIMEGL